MMTVCEMDKSNENGDCPNRNDCQGSMEKAPPGNMSALKLDTEDFIAVLDTLSDAAREKVFYAIVGVSLIAEPKTQRAM